MLTATCKAAPNIAVVKYCKYKFLHPFKLKNPDNGEKSVKNENKRIKKENSRNFMKNFHTKIQNLRQIGDQYIPLVSD